MEEDVQDFCETEANEYEVLAKALHHCATGSTQKRKKARAVNPNSVRMAACCALQRCDVDCIEA